MMLKAIRYLCPMLGRFVVYYNDNDSEHRKNTRNDDVSTKKIRSRTRCRCRINFYLHNFSYLLEIGGGGA